MTKVYLVRHCETQGNIKHIFQGTTDCDISELGEKQLKCLENRFNSISVDKIYSSPLIRAYKTALAVKGERDIPIIVREDLVELYGGVVEGKPFEDAFREIPILFEQWTKHLEDFAPEGGESMKAAYERMVKAFKEIVAENEGKTVAITSHGGAFKALMSYLAAGDIKVINDLPWCANTDVSLYEVDGDDIKTVFSFDHSHLPEEYLPSASKVTSYLKE